MLTIDALRSYGANVDDGLQRCMNNEAFYLRLAEMVVEDGSFERLQAALADGDLDAAFEAAHALKGALGNLALTPMSAPVIELTELLRHKAPGDYQAFCGEIMRQRDALKTLID